MAYQYPLNGGRINATIGGNTAGAGSLVSTGTLTLVGGNNITLSQAGNAVTISGGAGGGGGGVAIANSQTTYTSGTANLRVAGGAMTIGSTTGQSFNFSVPQTSSLAATGAFSISTNGSTISMGVAPLGAGISNLGNTSGTSGSNTNGLVLVGGNNITLSQSTNATGAYVTISGAAAGGAGSNTFGMSNLGNTSGTSGVISGSQLRYAFAGGNNITLSQSINASSATITISAPNQSVQTQGLQTVVIGSNTAGATASISSGAMTLAGGNNITLSQAGNGITISGGAGGGGGGIALANSQTTYTSGVANLNVAGGAMTIASTTGQSYNFFVPQTSSLSATGGLSISTNGSTISMGVPLSADTPNKRWIELGLRPWISNVTQLTQINGSVILQPFFNDGNLTISRINFEVSRVSNGSNHFSVHAGIYSYVNNTLISLVGSVSDSFSNTATASVNGIRRFAVDGLNVSTFGPGGYVLGMIFTGTATASMYYHLRGGMTAAPQVGAVLPGADQYNTATSYNIYPFWGRYTAVSAAMPGSIADSQVRGQFSGASQALNWWVGLNND